MMKLIALLFAGVLLLNQNAFSQSTVTATYPTHWFAGMKNPKLQLLLFGDNLGTYTAAMAGPGGVKVEKVHRFASNKYLALDLNIPASVKPGMYKILLTGSKIPATDVVFEIKPRRKGKGVQYAQPITPADMMYLIMPDRFSNGDPTNDRVPGMRDQTLRRDTVFNRHGGDLKGIENHLDYLKDLGVTALWLNPVWENDMPNRTEHGYAFTSHYKVDPRIGGEAAYKSLIDATHAKGMKMIQDAVYNHIGSFHHLFVDMPDSSWFHWWPKYTNTNYKEQTLFDPYAAESDRKIMTDGWFVPTMPDWNQKNLFAANFMIQHAIWTVEEFGIDGYRIDTYSYNDLEFMNRCNKALLDEYPGMLLFGETWVHGVPNQSFFTANNYNIPFKSNLPGATDFQTLWGITDAMTKDFGWTDGVNRLYIILAQDFVYKNPTNNVVFLDNHDINRFYSHIKEDTAKYKTALGWLLTTRGIPQLYYGGEVLMTGMTQPNDGYVRQDFPGGWPGDPQNKFTAAGRSEKESDIFNFVKTIANYRKQSKALTLGKLTQYLPVDGVYTYFRKHNNQTVMVIMNADKIKHEVDMKRFIDDTKGFTTMKNIVTGQAASLPEKTSLEPYSILIAELNK
jgi:neopullulanase